MGNSMRKFTFGLWFRSEHTKLDKTTEDTTDRSSESQTLDHKSYGVSVGLETDTSAVADRISNQQEAIDKPARVHTLTDIEGSNSKTLSENNDSSCTQKDITQKQPPPNDDAESANVQEPTAGNNALSINSEDGSLRVEEFETSVNTTNEPDIEYWNKIIESTIPEGDYKSMKVLILNAEEDNEVAEELAQNLREKFNCKIPRDLFNILYRVYGGQGLVEAQKWADILLIIVTPSWVQAVKNVQPTNETDSETTKYRYITLQRTFLKDKCVNYKIIPVVKSENDKTTFSDLIEVERPFTIDYIKDNFLLIATDFLKLSNEAKKLILRSGQAPSSDNKPSAADGEGSSPAPN